MRPSPSPSRETRYAIASSGYPGRARSYSSATERNAWAAGWSASPRPPLGYEGVTRKASKTASTARSEFISDRSEPTSPTSTVYQFFAS